MSAAVICPSPSMPLSTRMYLLLPKPRPQNLTTAIRQWRFNVSGNVGKSFSKHSCTANNLEPCFAVWNPEQASKHSGRLFREHPLNCSNPASQSVVIFHLSHPQCLTSSSEKDSPSLDPVSSSLFIYIIQWVLPRHNLPVLFPLRPTNVCLDAFASSRQSCSASSPRDWISASCENSTMQRNGAADAMQEFECVVASEIAL